MTKRYIFYYGIKTLDRSYTHEIVEEFSDNPKTLEKWLKLFRSFIKLIKETNQVDLNEC